MFRYEEYCIFANWFHTSPVSCADLLMQRWFSVNFLAAILYRRDVSFASGEDLIQINVYECTVKEQFTQKWKFSHLLLKLDISGASHQKKEKNSVAAFS